MISLEGHKLNYVVRFGFKTSDNIDKYKALLAGLGISKEMQVKRLVVNSNS